MTWRKCKNLLKLFVFGLPVFVILLTFIFNSKFVINTGTYNFDIIIDFISKTMVNFKIDGIYDIIIQLYNFFDFGVMPLFIQWVICYISYLIMVHFAYIIYSCLMFFFNYFEELLERRFKQ